MAARTSAWRLGLWVAVLGAAPPSQALSVPLRQNKNILQEQCAAKKWSMPQYKTTGFRGPSHAREFQAVCLVAEQTWCGDWHSTVKSAEGSAAAAALRTLGLSTEPPVMNKVANPHPTARSDLHALIVAND